MYMSTDRKSFVCPGSIKISEQYTRNRTIHMTGWLWQGVETDHLYNMFWSRGLNRCKQRINISLQQIVRSYTFYLNKCLCIEVKINNFRILLSGCLTRIVRHNKNFGSLVDFGREGLFVGYMLLVYYLPTQKILLSLSVSRQDKLERNKKIINILT